MMNCPVFFNFNLPVSLQMALDHVLFEDLQTGSFPVFLRFYSMKDPSVTVGYFSKKDTNPLVETLGREMPVVKRLTGGGVVTHREDLVFSMGADCSLFPFLKSTSESYAWIHSVIKAAFEQESVPAELFNTSKESVSPEVSRNLCFENPVPGDLVYLGKKIAGGAQKRQKNYFLHQGSISLDLRGRKSLKFRHFSEIIKNIFEKELQVSFQPQELSRTAMNRAAKLSETIYEPEGIGAV